MIYGRRLLAAQLIASFFFVFCFFMINYLTVKEEQELNSAEIIKSEVDQGDWTCLLNKYKFSAPRENLRENEHETLEEPEENKYAKPVNVRMEG